ncbi:uncharacterized protein [Notamacropus eugenii]|uniref:uncharacterized protein n=1 Tax=Notamacropus eugenii TaxID=9315 RepID=UPI003B672C35
MQKVIRQQRIEKEDFIQPGSQKEQGSLVQPQRRQDHEYSLGNWDQCQKKKGVISLLPQQDEKLSEMLSTEAQLGGKDQKIVQQQSSDKGWPIREDEASELSPKEGQKDNEPKVSHPEQQKENIASLTGISQVLQVIKQQHQCQNEAILKVMHQQQTHQKEAIRKVIGQQCQVEVVLEVMHQGWQHQVEAILKTVKLQQQSQEKAILKVLRQLGQQRPCEEENDHKVAEQNQEKEKKSKKHKRDVPNYFVAIPITNDQILDKIEDVQEFIYGKEPDLLKALIPVQTTHITIITAHLRTNQDVQKAISALEQSKVHVIELLEGKLLNMTFHGIGQFSNQVIYVKMSGEQEQQLLSRIAEAVERSFQEMNIDITGSKDFRPHLTFLKLSKAPALRRKGFRKIYSELYKEYEDCPFGTEVFSQIDLCSMHKKKQESGYYHCECTIFVAPRNTNEAQKLPTETEYLEEFRAHISPDPCPEAKTPECCLCISCIAEDDENPTEHVTSTGATCDTADHKTGVLVSDKISTTGKVLL